MHRRRRAPARLGRSKRSIPIRTAARSPWILARSLSTTAASSASSRRARLRSTSPETRASASSSAKRESSRATSPGGRTRGKQRQPGARGGEEWHSATTPRPCGGARRRARPRTPATFACAPSDSGARARRRARARPALIPRAPARGRPHGGGRRDTETRPGRAHRQPRLLAFTARSFELRVRLMLEWPPPLRAPQVSVLESSPASRSACARDEPARWTSTRPSRGNAPLYLQKRA